jgi:hypothetical protein
MGELLQEFSQANLIAVLRCQRFDAAPARTGELSGNIFSAAMRGSIPDVA